jgi:hypothetical protein
MDMVDEPFRGTPFSSTRMRPSTSSGRITESSIITCFVIPQYLHRETPQVRSFRAYPR